MSVHETIHGRRVIRAMRLAGACGCRTL